MASRVKKLLVVEDDENTKDYLKSVLENKGFSVDAVTTAEDALDLAQKGRYAAYVVDILLPKMDGKALLKRLRDSGDETPVLFVTALDEVQDRVKGLELGADDYIVKPFSPEELVARVKAVIRRAKSDVVLHVRTGNLEIDRVDRRVTYKGKRVDLTQREYQLLDYFVMHPGTVLTRDQISREVWGIPYTGESNFVDVYVRHLRQKIWDKDESQIKTVRGEGYMFVHEPEEAKARRAKKRATAKR